MSDKPSLDYAAYLLKVYAAVRATPQVDFTTDLHPPHRKKLKPLEKELLHVDQRIIALEALLEELKNS
jgi:hypothetical protein